MAQKQAAMNKKKENAEKWLKELQDFKLILDLKGKTINGACVDTMKKQLWWHQDIGGDDEIPPGFYHFKKVELWDTVMEVVKRHQAKQIGCEGEQIVFLLLSTPDHIFYSQSGCRQPLKRSFVPGCQHEEQESGRAVREKSSNQGLVVQWGGMSPGQREERVGI